GLNTPPIQITSSKNIIQATVEHFELVLSSFIQIFGGFGISASFNQEVTLASLVPGVPGVKTKVDELTFGASHVFAFAGIGPYFVDSNGDGVIDTDDTPSDSAVGVQITNLTFALGLFEDKQAAGTTYIALKANADSAGLVGIPVITATLKGIAIDANLAEI